MTARKASQKKAKPKPKAKKREGLSPKDAAFAAHYAEHGNACAAFRASRDCSRWSQKAVEVQACRTAAKPMVSLRVEELRAKAKAIAEDRYLVTQERIIAELASIAFHDAADFFEWTDGEVKIKASADLTPRQRAAVQGVSQTKGRAPKIEIKLCDKQAALVALGRTLAMFKDKTEVTGKDGGPIEVEQKPLNDDQAARIIAFALAKAAQPKQVNGHAVNGSSMNGAKTASATN